MNTKRREGNFYATKVRLFLNEYNGISLEEFCKAENVSYNKMCNCLGRPSYRKDKLPSQSPMEATTATTTAQTCLPELELRPLVIDEGTDGDSTKDVPRTDTAKQACSSILGYVNDVHLRTARQTEISIGKCPIKILVTLIKEMEAVSC